MGCPPSSLYAFPQLRGLGSVLPYRLCDVGSTDFDELSSGALLRRTPILSLRTPEELWDSCGYEPKSGVTRSSSARSTPMFSTLASSLSRPLSPLGGHNSGHSC